jgi:hypothetical protein
MVAPFIFQSFFITSLLTEIPGDIMSFRVFGQIIIVLNSVNIAKDLLEKHGDIYADRPAIPFYEMCVAGLLRHDFGLYQLGWGGSGFWQLQEVMNVGAGDENSLIVAFDQES